MTSFFHNDGTAPKIPSRLIERTMALFAVALSAHTGLTYLLYALVPVSVLSPLTTPYVLLAVVLGVLGVSGGLGVCALRTASKAAQGLVLALYVVLEAFLFLPLLHKGVDTVGLSAVWKTSVLSLTLFAALAGYVFYSKANLSSWGRYIAASAFGALGLTILAVLTGYHTSVLFSGGMIVLGSVWVLYDASNLVHHYDEEDYVAATMDLFSSFAFSLWHVLRLATFR